MKILYLSPFPLVALLLAILAITLQAEDLRLWWSGKRAPGMVSGMLVVRPGQVDLLDTFSTDLVVKLSDGREVSAKYHNHALVTVDGSSIRPAAPVDPALAMASASEVEPRILKLMNDAARGKAFDIRGILQRETRGEIAGARIVRIEKTEHASGLLGLNAVPLEMTQGPEGIRLKGIDHAANDARRGKITTYAAFDTTDLEALRQRNGEMLVEYEQKRHGIIVTPAKKDFVLYCEPYATEFRPVYTYAVAGQPYVGLSDVGRHGGPTLAIRLFEPCWAYYNEKQPQAATLVARVGEANGERLQWFSRACEGLFSQWGMPMLIAFASLMFALMGGLAISMAAAPPKAAAMAPPSSANNESDTAASS